MDIIYETGTNVQFTYQGFSEDGLFMAACTDSGHLAVMKMAPVKLVFLTCYDDERTFVKV